MSASVTVATKVCKKCLRELGLDQFYGCPRARDGRRGGCKGCANAASRAYYADNTVTVKANHAEWHRDNPEWSRAQGARWKAANPKVLKVHKARYYASHTEEYAAYGRQYRALELGALVGPIPTDIKAQLIEIYGPTCMVPGCENVDLQIDHIVPLSKGGAHAVDNFQLLCAWCNNSKGSRSSIDYRPAINQSRGNA